MLPIGLALVNVDGSHPKQHPGLKAAFVSAAGLSRREARQGTKPTGYIERSVKVQTVC